MPDDFNLEVWCVACEKEEF